MADINAFREKIRSYYRYRYVYRENGDSVRATESELAHAIPLHATELNKKLHGKKLLRPDEVQRIITILVEWKAITTQAQAIELLGLMECPHFSLADWNAPPLGELTPLPTSTTRTELPATVSPLPSPKVAPPVIEQPKPLFMVTDLPADVVDRPEEFAAVKHSILQAPNEHSIAITTALRGSGGYGKTILAQIICHDEDVRDAFLGGILWVTLGETSSNLVGAIEDLLYLMGHKRAGFTSLQASITKLKDVLSERERSLLVIDDVWRASDLHPFLQGGPHCVRLITTRNDRVLPASTQRIVVDAMRWQEAVQVLQSGLTVPVPDENQHRWKAIAARLGEYPLLLTLANHVLHERIRNCSESITDALTFLERALDKRGVIAFDAKNTSERHEAVAKTLEVSLGLLDPEEQARYEELAIFPDDTAIPIVTIERLWQATGGLDELDTDTLCQRLSSLSLLHSYDLTTHHIRLHDVVRKYLQGQVANRLQALHAQFLEAYGLLRWADLSLDEPYLWTYLAEHLIAAGQGEMLVTTVKDLCYLAKKVLARGVPVLEEDLARAVSHIPGDQTLVLLASSIARIAHLLQDQQPLREVEEALLIHLSQTKKLGMLCRAWEREMARPFLMAWHQFPDAAPSLVVRTLEGHTHGVHGCAVSPDGSWIVSASLDSTLKIWDARTGELRHTLEGHTDAVWDCAVSPDGSWIVSASWDHTLKIWDARTGELRHTLEGYSSGVKGYAMSPDGSWIVSACADGTLEIWDVQTGQVQHTLEGHTDTVEGCAVSPDGSWIVSASSDETLKIWDTQSGQVRLTLQDHTDVVKGCAISPDGSWILSASNDETLKIWDARTGKLRQTVGGVNYYAISPDSSWIVSVSTHDDRTLEIWNAQTGKLQQTLHGHIHWVFNCAVSPDGFWIVSACADGTLKIWDVQTGQVQHTLEGHTDTVEGCAVSPDGSWIASASADGILKIWDAQTGQIRLSSDRIGWMWDCAISPDGSWIISAHLDETLRIWNAQTAEVRLTLQGHTHYVEGCAVSPDGSWVVSASLDSTLKIWDAQSGQVRHSLQGHADVVNGCAVSPDGSWIVSASSDETLKIWDVQSGQVRHSLQGHTHSVKGCAVSPDGSWIVSASADRTLKIWDTQQGRNVATFRGDGPFFACAFHPDGVHLIAAGAQGLYFLSLVH